jgi:dUTP pyrophosphatase
MITDTGKIYNTGYYMYPRSSLSKTQLRLANSTGIIDSGYRGHLIGMFDVVNIQKNISDDNDFDYCGYKYDRYLQICSPGLVPILVKIVNNKEELGEETERGEGGFGSTGR